MAEQRGAAGMPPRSLAIAVMCALALASGMGGVAIDRILLRERVAKSILPDTGFHPLSAILRAPTPEDRRQVRSQLADELSLTPTQTIVVDSIMDAHTREFDALREGIRPEVERLTASVRTDVERVLTPEQRDRYRRLLGHGSDPAHDTSRVSH